MVRSTCVVCALSILSPLSTALAIQPFRNVTAEVGLGVESNSDIGPGCAFNDYDGDGDLDLMVVDGLGDPNRFFRQNSLRNFTEIAGTLGIADTGWGKAVVFADYDNDGDQDLLYTRLGTTNILYRKDGATYTNVSASSGFTFSAQNSGAAWADYDQDGFLDVYITNYNSATNRLMRNLGDGTFGDVTGTAGVANTTGFGFQPAWLDYDNDNDQDLYISNDIFGTPNVLYRNNADGTFTDVSAASGAGIDMSAMGVAIGDYDSNGFLDIFVSNTAAGNVLLRNNGNGTFTDVAASTGVIGNVVCWGADFFDYDHDGRLDLYVAVSTDDYEGIAPNGGPNDAPSERMESAGPYPNLLYRNTGAAGFVDVSLGSGANNGGKSFSTSLGDYDADGDLDIYVTNWWSVPGDSTSALLENRHIPRGGSADDWLRIKLIGTQSNRDGIGARVWLQSNVGWQMREKAMGSSYLAGGDPYLHFGLGTTTTVPRLFVRWPSGTTEQYTNVPGGQIVTLIEGDGIPTAVPELTGPNGWAIRGVVPNPIGEGTRLDFQLGDARAFAEIHDLQGRLLRSLEVSGARGDLVTIDWDRRDQRGHRLPAGGYLLSLMSGNQRLASQKIVLVD